MKEKLSDRMKFYEKTTDTYLFPVLPIISRIDGKAFHTFTRGLERPYDLRLSRCMSETTKELVQRTNASIGYTQSDEISLVWHEENFDSEIFFGARLLKMTSVLASMTTALFQRFLTIHLPEKVDKLAMFDARVWNVPTLNEAANYLLWREMDATRNSVIMAAQSKYSHKQLHGKNSSQMQEMLFAKGINWNDYPSFFKRGTYFVRKTVERPYTVEEIEKLPEKHLARTQKDLKVTRTEIATLDIPPLRSISNKKDVLFNGQEVQ